MKNTLISSDIPETEKHAVSQPSIYDVIIIGGGPAGLTAALYASRGGKRTLLIEGIMESSTLLPGGQLMLTPEIENYPGFISGSGEDLVSTMRTQALSFGTEIITEKVENLDLGDTVKMVRSSEFPGIDEPNVHHGRSVILATGAIARRLGVAGEDDYFGQGVSTCATCDGSFFQGEHVAIVGGGDTAIEDALYLSNIADKVTLIHRRDKLRAQGKDVEKLLSCSNVEIIWDTVVEKVNGENGKVNGIDLRNVKTGEPVFLPCKGLFVAVGHDPSTELLANDKGAYILDLTDSGYVVAHPYSAETSIPGFFVAGDVADDRYRQAVTAAASGCKAAMDVAAYLG